MDIPLCAPCVHADLGHGRAWHGMAFQRAASEWILPVRKRIRGAETFGLTGLDRSLQYRDLKNRRGVVVVVGGGPGRNIGCAHRSKHQCWEPGRVTVLILVVGVTYPCPWIGADRTVNREDGWRIETPSSQSPTACLFSRLVGTQYQADRHTEHHPPG